MSEFKFACPVCGQHLTADARTSGGQITCPTCFRAIIVPQAPALPDSKLILSAAQVGSPRPSPLDSATDLGPLRRARSRPALVGAIGWALLVLTAGAAVWGVRAKWFAGSPTVGSTQELATAVSIYPVPTNLLWTLDLSGAAIPEGPAVGKIHGGGFQCERATLKGGTLTLTQGPRWPPDLGLSVSLFAKKSADLSGKTIEVTAQRVPPLPRVVLRWKNSLDQARAQEFKSGYALKLVFGQLTDSHLPGKLYLCLPDESQTVVAGSFEATIGSPKAAAPPQSF